MLVVAELACAALLFTYASRRVGPFAALLPTALLLFLGPAWQNLLWPFQVAWFLSLGAGIGRAAAARPPRPASAMPAPRPCSRSASPAPASASRSPSGSCSSCSWPAAGRGSSRLPLAVYAVWWLAYRPAGLIRHNITLAPAFAADAAAGAFGAR